MATSAKSKPAKSAAKAAGSIEDAAKETMEAFGYPKFEVPEMVRSYVEQTMQQTREAYDRIKSAAEEATDILENSVDTSRSNVRDAQFKAIDMVKANTDASFELARQLLGATTVTDVVEMQSAFARERFEAFVAYSKDLQDMVNKAGAEASKPAKAMMDKAMNLAK